jgi:hypothetical protein
MAAEVSAKATDTPAATAFLKATARRCAFLHTNLRVFEDFRFIEQSPKDAERLERSSILKWRGLGYGREKIF